MQKILLLLFCLVVFQSKAHKVIEVDSLEKKTEKFLLYVAPGYSMSQFVETSASFADVYLGIRYHEKLDLSLSYSFIIDNFKKQIIFPSTHEFDQTGVCIRAYYSFFNFAIKPHSGIAYHFNQSSWNPLDDSNDTFREYFHVIEVFVGANWSISDVISLNASGGYNFTDGIELVGLKNEDFYGFTFNVMLQIRILKF